MPSNFTIDLASNAIVVHPNNVIGQPIGIMALAKHDFTGELVLFGGYLIFTRTLNLSQMERVA